MVSIDVYEDGGAVLALFEENGKGFGVASTLETYASRGSLGLLQMRESARLIGAQLSLDSSPGQGTRVRLRIPCTCPSISRQRSGAGSPGGGARMPLSTRRPSPRRS